MKRLFIFIAVICVSLQFGFIGPFLGQTTSQTTPVVNVARTIGLQTNMTELARFDAIWDAELGSGTATTDRANLGSHATTARDSWSSTYTITAGAWESDANTCEPVGATSVGDEYNIRNAATDIFAMALYGALLDLETPGSGDTYFAATKTRLQEFEAITDFEASDVSDANECIIDLGSAVPHLLEAAWLLEDAGYTGVGEWETADKLSFAIWARDEVFPLTSWGIRARKNNWGITTYAASVAIAAYGQYLTGFDSVSEWNGATPTIRTPTNYLAIGLTRLSDWLDNSANEFDSQCQDATFEFGLQGDGAFPDELRREAGGTANCSESSLAFACGDASTGSITDCGGDTGAHFYQQKATNNLVRVCEMFRRLDGNGLRCFELTSHDNDPGTRQAPYDAMLFSTTALEAPSGTYQGIFRDYFVNDNTQGFRYVGATYYDDFCVYNALDDGNVDVRGGRDYAYTKITHREGVAYNAQLTELNVWDCTLWDDGYWDNQLPSGGEWGTDTWDNGTWGP